MIVKKTPEEIKVLARNGEIAAFALKQVVKKIKPGITALELDKIARRVIMARGAEPSFLGYRGYPAAICVSINDEVVHGIPKNRLIKNGDVVSIDLGIKYKGMFTDVATTVYVGQVPQSIKKLVAGTKKSLSDAIKVIKPGIKIGDIEYATGKTLKENGLSAVLDLSGHGVGHAVHEDPSIKSDGIPDSGETVEEGMVFAIEPMATLGSGQVKVASDGWTVKTVDHSISAHFEHSVVVTANGSKLLTESH